jgi:hypothetical protein
MKNKPVSSRLRSEPILLALLIGLVAASAAAETTITPSLTISEEYTDNVDQDATGAREEFITVVSPRIDLNMQQQRYQANFSYSPGFTLYHRDEDSDAVRHNATALISAQLTQQTELMLTDSYVRTDEPRTTLEDDEVYGEWIDPTLRRGRETWYSNTAGVSLNHRFGQEDSFGIGYRHRMLENDDPVLEDSQRHTMHANLAYWFNAAYGFSTHLSYARGLFDSVNQGSVAAANDDLKEYQGTLRAIHRLGRHFQYFLRYSHTKTEYDGVTPDYIIYDPGLGFSWGINPTTTLDFDLGYFFQDREGVDEESGPSFSGRLQKAFKRGSLGLSVEGGYQEASYGAENLGLDIYYQTEVSATYELTRQLALTADVGYQYNKYVNTTPQRKDDVYQTAIGLRYRPAALRWLSLALTGRRYEVQSTDPDNDLSENSVMFSITLTPVTPYRFD